MNFFSPGDVAEAVADLLQNRARARALGDAARRHVEQRYDREVCVARQLALMDLVASRSINA